MISHNAFADNVTATIPVSGAIHVAVNPNTHLVYVATGQSQLQVINGSNNTVIATIQTHAPTPCPDSTAYVVANPVTDLIYAGSKGCMYKTGPPETPPDWILPTVSVINGSTNQIVSTINFGAVQEPAPIPIAVNPVTNKVYVAFGGQVDVFNGTTNQAIAYINAQGNDVAANPQTNTIYVHDENVIYVIDGTTDSVVKNFSWGKVSNYDVGVNTATNRIYISNNDNTVSVIDGSTYQVIATVNGTANGFVGINQATNKIYVSSPGASQYVTVIDGATNTIVNQVLVGQNSYGIGVDTSTNKIYVANAGDKTISVIDGNAQNSSPPPSPPSPPQNLQAVPMSYSQVNLSWVPPANNGGSPLIEYQIERSTDGGNTWSIIGSTQSNSTSYSNVGLLPNTSYAYRVLAINSYPVPSSPSNVVTANTPQGGFIAINNVKSASGTISSSSYQFMIPNFNVGNGSNRLLLVGINAFPSHFSINPVVTSVTFNGVSLTESVQSNQDGFWYLKNPTGTGTITVTTNEALPVIVGAYAFRGVDLTNPIPNTAVNWSPTQTLTTQYPNDWIVDLVSDYWDTYPISNPTCTPQWDLVSEFYAASSAASSASPGPLTCSWTSNPTSHNWSTQIIEIKAANSTSSIPSAPTGLAATTTSSSQINLSWTTPTNNGGSTITGYMIERSTDNGTTWSTIVSNTGSTSTAYSDTGLAASTTYTYSVSAINSAGTSAPSNTTSAATSATTITTGIALSNTQSTSGSVSSSNTITLSGFNVGSDNNRLLVVGVSANNNDVASVTFGGMSLKNIAYSFYNNDAEFWYLKNPSGTGDITVTMNGPTQAVVGAYAFSGVNQTLPIPTHVIKHNTIASSPNISITTKYANDLVLDLPSIYGGSTLGTPTCTQQWDLNMPNAITGASSSIAVPTAGAVTCGWTASSADLYDDVAVEINAASR